MANNDSYSLYFHMSSHFILTTSHDQCPWVAMEETEARRGEVMYSGSRSSPEPEFKSTLSHFKSRALKPLKALSLGSQAGGFADRNEGQNLTHTTSHPGNAI